MRKFSVIFGEGALSLAIIFLLLEIALRAFPQLIPLPALFDFDKDLRAAIAARLNLQTERMTYLAQRDDGGPPLWFYKPYVAVSYPMEITDIGAVKTVTMDDMGFCNPPDDSYHRDAVDMITIGDSFTWCTTVNPDETWTHRLGALVNAPMYNLGAPGRGLYEYIFTLKQFGLSKNPRIVIMAVYEGNDLRDALSYVSYRAGVAVSAGRPGEGPCSLPYYWCAAYRRLKYGWVGRTSYAFNLAIHGARYGKDGVMKFFAGKNVSDGTEALSDFRYRIAGSDGSAIRFNRENADTDEPSHAAKLRDGAISLEAWSDPLRSFVEIARERRFVPAVLYIPSAHTAYADYVIFESPSLRDVMARFSNKQRKYLRENAKIGFTFIDLTGRLQQRAQDYRTADRLLYFPTNLHLTRWGHEEIARYVAPIIRELKK